MLRQVRNALSALVIAAGMVAVGTPGAAVGETAALAASCEATISDNGTQAPPLRMSGTFQILGTAPATARVGESLIVSGVQVRLSVDWDVLGPELEARGVTHLSGHLLGAWFDVTVDGVADWPAPIHGDMPVASFPVEQLGTGISTAVNDIDLRRWVPTEPGGLMRLANYDDVYFTLRKYDTPQVALTIQCAPDAGQDMTFGHVVIQP